MSPNPLPKFIIDLTGRAARSDQLPEETENLFVSLSVFPRKRKGVKNLRAHRRGARGSWRKAWGQQGAQPPPLRPGHRSARKQQVPVSNAGFPRLHVSGYRATVLRRKSGKHITVQRDIKTITPPKYLLLACTCAFVRGTSCGRGGCVEPPAVALKFLCLGIFLLPRKPLGSRMYHRLIKHLPTVGHL